MFESVHTDEAVVTVNGHRVERLCVPVATLAEVSLAVSATLDEARKLGVTITFHDDLCWTGELGSAQWRCEIVAAVVAA